MSKLRVKSAVLSILLLIGVTGLGVSGMSLRLDMNNTTQGVGSVITEGAIDNPVCLAKQNSNVKQSKNKNSGYWYEYTELELEAPGRFKLNPIIKDSEGNILRSVKSYADVSFTTTTKDCEDGYMKTIIEAKNNYKYSSLGDDEFVMLKWAPIDMYSGRFFEDFDPDGDYVLKTYVGTKSK
ncbi:hypothetical protein [Oribacterium sp. P6A1]|uniref:hypothetical protein n=1 Tax=Oribacterium sp. P6A1 TaxID=1410612 RepID=UPI0005628D3C|nr:hypothetical protein [Oribacterium sp. P6A1]